MILGVIFDFDNTIYDYNICNKNSLSKVFIHIEENFKKENVKDVYEKINIDIKQSNNYCNKFNKNIYFKRLLESLNIPFDKLDCILQIYNNEFDKNLLVSIYPNIEDLKPIVSLFSTSLVDEKNKVKIPIRGVSINKEFLDSLGKLIIYLKGLN